MEGNLDALNRLVPNVWRKPAAPAKTAATRPVNLAAPALIAVANEEGATATGSAPAPAASQRSPVASVEAQRFVDLAAVRLTGRLLSPASNQATLEILGQSTPDEMKQALLLVSLLPETSLR